MISPMDEESGSKSQDDGSVPEPRKDRMAKKEAAANSRTRIWANHTSVRCRV